MGVGRPALIWFCFLCAARAALLIYYVCVYFPLLSLFLLFLTLVFLISACVAEGCIHALFSACCARAGDEGSLWYLLTQCSMVIIFLVSHFDNYL